ncbi:MAG TPA: TetR/AcrR family transcriptional regulator [Stellaceae bacterium]
MARPRVQTSPKRGSLRPRHPAFDPVERHDQRRAAMVRTAVHLFNRSGFHATSVEEIARELGLSKALLYHYFVDKTELLYECYLYALDGTLASVTQAAKEGRTGREKLETYVRRQFETLAGADGAAWVLSDLSSLAPQQRRQVRKQSRAIDKMLQAFLAEGLADGTIIGAEPKITEFFVIGALNWLPRWYKPGGSLSGKELAEIFLRLVIDGLRPRA